MKASSPPSTSYVVSVMLFNFFSSVFVITVNKVVFKTYEFNFPTLLTGLHFVFTFLGLCGCAAAGLFKIKSVPFKEIIPLALSFVGFVVFNNLSLKYNSVGFYQLMKVMTTPVIVVIQYLLFNVPLHNKLKLALVPICIGVTLATVSDVETNTWGTIHALLGIISTSFYQIWVKSKQQDLGLDSYQLLFLQSPVSAIIVFIISSFTEDIYGKYGWLEYDYTIPSLRAILTSCLFAFLVNLSIFMVIGKTSPIAYNVLGHFKLCVILLTGFLYFGEEANALRLFGTFLTFAGVVAYSTIQQNVSNGWDKRENKTNTSGSVTVNGTNNNNNNNSNGSNNNNADKEGVEVAFTKLPTEDLEEQREEGEQSQRPTVVVK